MKPEDFSMDSACEHILWIWYQYGTHRKTEDGLFLIDHSCMSSGEDATDFLEHYGYGSDIGWSIALTRKGLEVLWEHDCIGIDEVKKD